MTNEETAKPSPSVARPETLKGFQDCLPADAIARHDVIEKIRKVFERFGFQPIETAALEYLSTLVGTGGEETNKQLFALKSPEDEDIALRFDLTVPFARFISQHLDEIKLPFRRYHVGSAWRADKPGPGRFREFTQFDIDAAGSSSLAVDAEIIRAMCDVLAELNVAEFTVLVNHRKIVDALLYSCGIEDLARHKHILRVVDKLAKVGIAQTRQELGPGRIDESGDPIRGVGLDAATIAAIEAFLNVTGPTRSAVLASIATLLPPSDQAKAAIAEVQSFLEALNSLGVPEARVHFWPSLARGLDYYTGPVFETILPQAPRFGSVMGGGRYDGLVNRFLGIDIPATGASIGIDRFLAALREIGALTAAATTTDVLVTVMDPKLLQYCLAVATQLRSSGINTEVYFGAPADRLKAQLSLANRRGIRLAVILGEDEVKAGAVSVKDLSVGLEKRKDATDHEKFRSQGKAGQVTVPRDQLIATVREILAQMRAP